MKRTEYFEMVTKDGTYECVLIWDTDKMAGRLSRRALKNKDRKATGMNGAVTFRVLDKTK